MRKLTENQKDVLSCLNNEFNSLDNICDKFGKLQGEKGFSSWGYHWKTHVSKCLQSLIVRELVEYKYRGQYKLKTASIA